MYIRKFFKELFLKGINTNGKYDIDAYLKYLEYLRQLHECIMPKLYVEIGVRNGDSIVLAGDQTVSIGIDPMPCKNENLKENTHLFCQTSDEFFEQHSIKNEFSMPIDFAFIDGMHLFEYYLRDFINLEKNSHKNTVICLHDTTPVDEISSLRERKQGFWTGDVFKIVLILCKYRPDLKIVNMNEGYTGLCCVTNLDPCSKVLSDNYSQIKDEYMALSYKSISDIRNDLYIEADSAKFLEYLRNRNTLAY